MSNLKGCYSHNTDDWRTPTWLYDIFMQHKYIDCFPFQSDYDEFSKLYFNKNLFVNPPYSKLDQVANWLETLSYLGNKVVLLIPVRTDTKYFYQLSKFKPNIVFIKGRLHFNNSKAVAPFPSMLLFFGFDECASWDSMDKDYLIAYLERVL